MELINTKFPKSKKILPVPYQRYPLYNYPVGFDNQLINNAIAPKHDDKIIYANELPAAPRSQLKPAFPITKPKVYKKLKVKKQCYKGYSKEQGMPIIYCSSGGNANFVRGNKFSVNYNRNKIYRGLEREIEINQPEIVDSQYYKNNTNFYPYPNFNYTKNKNYKTYPHSKSYSNNGIPFYHESILFKH